MTDTSVQADDRDYMNFKEDIDHIHNGVINEAISSLRQRNAQVQLNTTQTSEDADTPSVTLSRMSGISRFWDNDFWKIILLVILYVLQGIPLGIGASIPYMLQARKVKYSDQAIFSFIYWPFSMKLLWAPIVDSVYSERIGRRKSWLIPTQYLIAIFMLYLSTCVDTMMGNTGQVSISFLTVIFFLLNFLAATQDIAVDGWALTMLRRENIGWVSTCNTIGQTIGYLIGNIVFLTLESEDFANKYLRAEPTKGGIISFSGFLYFWSIIFFVSTTMVMLFKREGYEFSPAGRLGIRQMYLVLWDIVCRPAVYSLIFILLTIKMGFAAADTVTSLKLIEVGMPKEHMALMAIPMIPVNIVAPILITRWTPTRRPLNLILTAMPFRLMLGLLYAIIVWWAPYTKIINEAGDVSFPPYFYAIMIVSLAFHQVAVYCMYVPMMSFFASISDPTFGGTYMTLLNTIANLGGNWPQTLSLWFVDYLSWNGCLSSDGQCHYGTTDGCQKPCVVLDGYYIESVICCVIGFLWIYFLSKRMRKLQVLGQQHWSIVTPSSAMED